MMPRTPARISQADINRAIRAARQAGAIVVEVQPTGVIRILLDEAAPVAPQKQSSDDDIVL
jgi:hypothetical protein